MSKRLAMMTAAHLASSAPSFARFLRAARSPRRAQESLLRRFLEANADTAYGRAHGYDRVRTVADFQRRVPIVDYDALSPWVDRAVAGEARVLSADPIVAFEPSSGSSGHRKLVPYTKTLLAEFGAATSPWLFLLHARRPELVGATSYWSVSPAAREPEVTPGGVRIGFASDAEYFGPIARRYVEAWMAVPGSVARIPGLDAWRRETARYLLGAADLGIVSVWNPSFLTLLMEAIERDLDAILAGLARARADAIRRALDRAGAFVGEAIWPRLGLLSSWTDGHARGFVPAMRRFFPTVPLQPKGLLATEGVVSFPVGVPRSAEESLDQGAAAALTSHFLEFVDLEAPDAPPRLADELRVGGRYSPLLTTGNGFARYQLRDAVACEGHFHGAPRLRFMGKLDRTSDLCGEKLDAVQVERAIETALQAAHVDARFVLLAPSDEATTPPRYTLYVEADASDAALARLRDLVEAELARGYHYKYGRDLGQLGPVRAWRVTRGWATYEAEMVRRGAKAGDVKPTRLCGRRIWAGVFENEAA